MTIFFESVDFFSPFENMDVCRKRALRKVCDKTILLDETVEVKQALVWRLSHGGKEDKRETVLSMSKKEINETIMR